MIKVLIPHDFEFCFYKDELKKMYEEAKDKICDTNNFEFIIHNTLYYSFIKGGTVLGAIYFFKDEDRLYMNAYAGRKHLADNIKCVKMSLEWFICDIYAEAQNKASVLCLLRSGFKRLKNNIFVYKR